MAEVITRIRGIGGAGSTAWSQIAIMAGSAPEAEGIMRGAVIEGGTSGSSTGCVGCAGNRRVGWRIVAVD